MGVLIRPFLPSDAEALTLVYLDSARHHAAIDPKRYIVPEFEDITRRYIEGHQRPPGVRGITMVEVEDGQVRGFVDAWLHKPADMMHRPCLCCYVSEVAVEAASRSQGIGAALMTAIEEWARSEEAELAVLEFNVHNPRAGAFYQQRLGYQPGSVMAIKWL